MTAGAAGATSPSAQSTQANVFERATASTPALKGKAIAKATIVGAGPAGLAQASLLLKRAKEIGLTELTIVELRSSYTRPVGLALRQMSLDALAWLNPDAHKALVKKSGLDGGTPFIDGRDASVDAGSAQRFDQERVHASGDSVAAHAQAMMSQKTMALVTLSDVEQCYWSGLEKLASSAGVKLRKVREHDVDVSKDATSGTVSIAFTPMGVLDKGERKAVGAQEKLAAQDLVIVAQGVNCAVRRKLDTPGGETASPADRFIAAVFSEPGKESGSARSVYREDVVVDTSTGETQTVRLVRGVHARNGSHWCLAQVPESLKFTESIDALSQAERARLRAVVAPRVQKQGRAVVDADLVGQKVAEEAEAYFKQQHAKTGTVDLPITYGPSLFSMQAKRFSTTLLGANCVAVGDAVGTSHFNVSGGAATGVTTHTLALDRFLTARARGADANEAMQSLDRDLQQATLVWQLFGITQFEGDPRELRDTFYARERLAKLLPPDVLEQYWPRDGSLPSSGPWHEWLAPKASAQSVPPTDAVRALTNAAKQASQVKPIACVNSSLMFARDP